MSVPSGPDLGGLLLPGGDEPSPRGAARRRPPRRRRTGLLVVVLAVIALLVAGVVGGGVLLVRHLVGSNAANYAGSGDGVRTTVHVAEGDGAAAIGTTLLADRVVASTGAFTAAASADDRSRTIQPGYYSMQQHMSARSALTRLLDPAARLQSRVTVPEGSSLTRTLALIAAHTEVPLASLQAAVATPAALGLPSYAGGRVDGFLFPATYDIEPGSSAVEALTQFTARFGVAAQDVGLQAGARALGLTPAQVVTVASLIEGEAATATDRPKVASVIYNRLRAGQSLGLESTVRFALGGFTGTVTQSDLTRAARSPYDTYTHTGLPPSPIDNPGEAALTAALHPAKTSDLYFVTLPKTNQTLYAESYAGFEQITAQCRAQGGCGG